MLRTSSYTIYVTLPESTDEMLLVHGYTGAFDRVSRKVGDYVRSLEAGAPAPPMYGDWVTEPALQQEMAPSAAPSDSTIQVLTRRGYLTTMSADEEIGYFARVVKRLHEQAMHNTPSYIFMPTYNCNLRCSYCFQDHMRTNPAFKHLLRTISPEMVDRIVAAFPTLESAHGFVPGNPPYRNVGFFGGEPLLAENRPAVTYIMERIKAAGPVRFWAVSNATELEAYEDFLGPDWISEVQITLDGPPEEHDKRRIYADGSGSFSKIARNIDLCLDHGTVVSLRMNIDRANVAQLPELADTIVAHRWDQRAGFSTYTAPITNAEQSVTLVQIRSRYFTSWELDQAVDDLRAEYPSMRVIGRPDDSLEGRVRKLFDQHATSPQLKSAFCGAHTGMYIFDAFGDIYACWERTGDTSIRIGHVLEDGQVEINQTMNRLWRTRTPASNPTCRKCRYALHCGGGCAVLAEGRSGKIHSNHCDAFGDRFRHTVAAAYAGFTNGDAVKEQSRVCDL